MRRPLSACLLFSLAALLGGGTFGGALSGCGSTEQRPPRTAELTLGAPLADGSGFVPLVGGQPAELVAGAQGGFHVWMKFRLGELSPMRAELERTASRVSDRTLVLRTRGAIDIGPAGDGGYYESPAALPMFMCPSPIGISIVDAPIEFQLRFTDEAGLERARQTVTLVPHCPDAQRDLCVRLCTG